MGYDGKTQWERKEEALSVYAHGIKTKFPVVIIINVD